MTLRPDNSPNLSAWHEHRAAGELKSLRAPHICRHFRRKEESVSMISIETLLLYTVGALVIIISPGPDFIYVTRAACTRPSGRDSLCPWHKPGTDRPRDVGGIRSVSIASILGHCFSIGQAGGCLAISCTWDLRCL